MTMQKSLEEVKAIIEEIEPIARQFTGIMKKLGEKDLVNMFISDSHISFYAYTKDDVEVDGQIWNNGDYDLLISGEKINYGRDDERAVS